MALTIGKAINPLINGVNIENQPYVITNLAIESTTIPSYTAPSYGTSIITLIGSGSVAYIIGTLSGVSGTWSINGGNTLSLGALYEFQLHLLQNDY